MAARNPVLVPKCFQERGEAFERQRWKTSPI